MSEATLYAGISEINAAFYRRIRFGVGDPAAIIDVIGGDGESLLIIRDIEMDRAKQHARADNVACPKDFEPSGGLSGDRETATAQATGEALKRMGVTRVRAHRTTPLVFTDHIAKAGVEVVYDPELGLYEQRQKDAQELQHLRDAQAMTERVMRYACEMVANATAGSGGVLQVGGKALTAERVRSEIDIFLLREGYENADSIVAGGAEGADCHNRGAGELKTGETVIIDIFPKNKASRYCGDCTRTVVHGEIPDEIQNMHTVVQEAKVAGIAATRAGATGEDVHRAVVKVIEARGYHMGLHEGRNDDSIRMPHGTGHGIGLDVHEPPLLDFGGPALLVGDVLTVEPGLYGYKVGGIRIEDMVAVTADGCENFNSLPEGLDWAS